MQWGKNKTIEKSLVCSIFYHWLEKDQLETRELDKPKRSEKKLKKCVILEVKGKILIPKGDENVDQIRWRSNIFSIRFGDV